MQPCRVREERTHAALEYSELNLNQYSVGSPYRNVCTVCGSPPCPDLNLIHYKLWNVGFTNPTYALPHQQAT
ncbi:hypothetical protein CA838_01185 [Eikenella corrodens]|nr:hypothetical protein CA838_01185 [Eikenella corrodens]